MNKQLFAALCGATILVAPAIAHDDHTAKRADNHAPIGVMADHFHKKGDFMASLRGMTMKMGDPVNTTSGPQKMTMNMAMLGVMYAPSDKITLMAGLNYSDTSMDVILPNSNTLSMGASNIGDFKFSAIMPLYEDGTRRFHVTLGASAPLGSTDNLNPLGARLALTMQPGTGSWGFMPSATYTHFMDQWSYGVQANGRIWLDDNDFNERMGDRFEVTSWAAYQVSETISLSTRLAYTDQEAVTGSALPILTDERQLLTGYVGANFLIGSHRLAVEAGTPLTQDRNGNALDIGFSLTVGWQKSF